MSFLSKKTRTNLVFSRVGLPQQQHSTTDESVEKTEQRCTLCPGIRSEEGGVPNRTTTTTTTMATTTTMTPVADDACRKSGRSRVIAGQKIGATLSSNRSGYVKKLLALWEQGGSSGSGVRVDLYCTSGARKGRPLGRQTGQRRNSRTSWASLGIGTAPKEPADAVGPNLNWRLREGRKKGEPRKSQEETKAVELLRANFKRTASS